jgi:hypothetical protein
LCPEGQGTTQAEEQNYPCPINSYENRIDVTYVRTLVDMAFSSAVVPQRGMMY